MTTPKKHPYYSFDKISSYNGVFNFVIGGRGLGKTYGAKVRAIKKFLKTGEQFIYLRRYKSELDAKRSYFTDFEHTFPEWDFRVKGSEAQVSPVSARDDEKRDWSVMGYFMALSTTQSKKSQSFTHVKTIIFDEFIIEKGALHYLPDETTILTNFYSTVDRGQDKTTVYLLANSVSIMNPYFISFEIRPDQESEFVVRKNGFIVCHFPESKDFADSIYETRFGQFIKDTDYADYAIGNAFGDNHENMLEMKDGRAIYQFTVETKTGKFSLWYNGGSGIYYIQDRLPKNEKIFTIDPSKMAEGKIYTLITDGPLNYLRKAFRHGNVRFDKPSTRNIFIDIFKR